jgi:hypothetical protein
MGHVQVNSTRFVVLCDAGKYSCTLDYIDGSVENGDIEHVHVDNDSLGRRQCRCRY